MSDLNNFRYLGKNLNDFQFLVLEPYGKKVFFVLASTTEDLQTFSELKFLLQPREMVFISTNNVYISCP